MTIYVVSLYGRLIGLFSSKDKAEEHIAKRKYPHEFTITMWKVDDPDWTMNPYDAEEI